MNFKVHELYLSKKESVRQTNETRFVGGLHKVVYEHRICHDFSTHTQEGAPSAKWAGCSAYHSSPQIPHVCLHHLCPGPPGKCSDPAAAPGLKVAKVWGRREGNIIPPHWLGAGAMTPSEDGARSRLS